ncbi:hypothetical protein [Xanthomonas nasturtii]|nr:hypothetical protein [Xanthomonas nasturtii]WVL56466.1 hypothetical protein M3O54_019485 [Xanthomonas nasturtii]
MNKLAHYSADHPVPITLAELVCELLTSLAERAEVAYVARTPTTSTTRRA